MASGPADVPSFDFHFQKPQTRPIKITGEGSISKDGVQREKELSPDLRTRSAIKGDQADSQHQPGVGCHQGWGQGRGRSRSTWGTCTDDVGWGMWGVVDMWLRGQTPEV